MRDFSTIDIPGHTLERFHVRVLRRGLPRTRGDRERARRGIRSIVDTGTWFAAGPEADDVHAIVLRRVILVLRRNTVVTALEARGSTITRREIARVLLKARRHAARSRAPVPHRGHRREARPASRRTSRVEPPRRAPSMRADPRVKRSVGLAGEVATHALTSNLRAATTEALRGRAELIGMLDRHAAAPIASRAGRAAEIHHSTTFNVNAALRRSAERATTTDALGLPHAPADVLVRGPDGRVVAAAQLKLAKTAESNAQALARERYRGMQLVGPEGQVGEIRDVARRRAGSLARRRPDRAARYADAADRVTDRLQGRDAQSDPLSRREARALVRDPDRLSRPALRGELVGAIKTGALAGGGAALGVSVIGEGYAVWRGDRDIGDAALAVAAKTAVGAVQGAATAGLGTVVRHGLLRAGATGLARGMAPVAIASAGVELGIGVARYAAGDLSGRELACTAGRAVTSSGGAWAGAALGSAIFPGVGTVVGGLIGGVLGSIFW